VASEDILRMLRTAVADGDPERAEQLTREALTKGEPPLDVLDSLVTGVRELGEKFGKGEVFIPDLIMGGQAMKAGSDVLKPALKGQDKERMLGTILIGTVKGDVHSIGKDIVATMLESEGFEIRDLGEDVPDKVFVEKVKELTPDALGLSSLMTMTMPAQRDVIDALGRDKIRSNVRVLIGGAPTTRQWAEEIAADGWAGDAVSAAKEARRILAKN